MGVDGTEMGEHAEDADSDAPEATVDATKDAGPAPEGGAPVDAAGRRPGGDAADGGEAVRRLGRVLESHRPRRVAPREADRRAAVVLVLRPGGSGEAHDERAPGSGGRTSGGPGRSPAGGAVGGGPGAPVGRSPAGQPERSAGGRRVEVPAPGPAAPLFPRPLPPELAGLEALFILRAEREGDPWSGQVGLPGGHEEPGDADLPDAALRELREETGLVLPRARLLGRLDDVHPRSRRLPSVAVSPFVAWHGAEAGVTAGPEVAGHFWTPLAELEIPSRRALLAFRREGAYRVFPGVAQGEALIWGLTFVILRRFLSLLPRGEGVDRRGDAWPRR